MVDQAARNDAAAWLRTIAERVERGEYTDQAFVLIQRSDGVLATHNGFRCLGTLLGGLEHAQRYYREVDHKEVRQSVDGNADPLADFEDRMRDLVTEIVRRTGGPDLSTPDDGSS